MTRHIVGASRPLSTAKPGELVSEPKMLRLERLLEADTAYRSWPQGELERKPVGERFWNFFPTSPFSKAAEVEYAAPLSEEFWLSYGEQADWLIRQASHLAESIAPFEHRTPGEFWSDRGAFLGITQINDAAWGTSLSGQFRKDGSLELKWSSMSLLGCFAVMILEDLAGGQRVMRCPVCQALFMAMAHQTRFCSTTCRNTYHKRAQRRREADADKATQQ